MSFGFPVCAPQCFQRPSTVSQGPPKRPQSAPKASQKLPSPCKKQSKSNRGPPQTLAKNHKITSVRSPNACDTSWHVLKVIPDNLSPVAQHRDRRLHPLRNRHWRRRLPRRCQPATRPHSHQATSRVEGSAGIAKRLQSAAPTSGRPLGVF